MRVVKAFSVLAIGLFSTAAFAQTYPSKPIKMIAPYPPGGTTDIVARAVSQPLAEALGQAVVVENRTGAGGLIGHDMAAKSPPDGYTLVLGNSAMLAVSVSLYKNMPYDPIKDFAPITQAAAGALVLTVNPSVPAKSLKELLALAKSRSGGLNAGLSAVGSMHHLTTEMIKAKSGVQWTNIPYKGSGPMLVDLLGGQVDFAFDNIPSALQYIKADRLRAIAVSSPKRTALLPGTPTLTEAGMPDVEAVAWHGVLAPAGTPKEIVARLNSEIVKILQSPAMKQRLEGLGLEAVGDTPEQFAQFIREENIKWAKVAKESGAQLE